MSEQQSMNMKRHSTHERTDRTTRDGCTHGSCVRGRRVRAYAMGRASVVSEPLDTWFLPRDELIAMSHEWVPDSCPVLNSMIEEIERDPTCPGLDVSK